MTQTNQTQRQSLGCGYEAEPPVGVPVRPWSPPDGKYGFRHFKEAPLPAICPGYLTSLAECSEVWHAHTHWSKSQLQLLHPRPTAALLTAIEILDGAIAGARAWESAPDKGER